jgi:hypothetical protein
MIHYNDAVSYFTLKVNDTDQQLNDYAPGQHQRQQGYQG